MRTLFGLLLCCGFGLALAAGPPALEARKIDFLIGAIETLQDAQFIRDGTTYAAQAAADHLRLKLRYAGSRVASADDFIRLCGTGSSISGKPYQIRYADGRLVSSEAFLRQRLNDFRP